MPHKPRRPLGKARPPLPSRPKTTHCILATLPPDLLQRIFRHDRAITLDNAVLSKALLPHTLAALAHRLSISNVRQLGSLCVALSRRPALAIAVEHLVLAIHDTLLERDIWSWGHPGAGQLGRNFELRDYQECVDNLELDPCLLQDLCRILIRVRTVRAPGPIARVLLERSFLEGRPFPCLARLELFLPPELVDWEPFDDGALSRLSLIPSLRSVTVQAGVEELPVDFLNLSAASYTPPRSLFLIQFELDHFDVLGREARVVFTSLQPGLQCVSLEAMSFYPGAFDDLLCLLPTLEFLKLALGDLCPAYVPRESPSPKFDSPALALAFPNLTGLVLVGPILSPSTIPDVIQRLSQLVDLCLGPHGDIDGRQLCSLLCGGPRSWPKIGNLRVDTCSCDPSRPRLPPGNTLARLARIARHRDGGSARTETGGAGVAPKKRSSGATRAPAWPPNLRASDVRELVTITDSKDVAFDGTALCAARLCGGDGADGHRCPAGWG